MTDLPDPFPRELIDTWPLHDARQELLEEIVSQPGPEQSPSHRRLLVPVGIAAALLLVVGGAWAAISAGGGSDRDDDASVAASVAPTATDRTADATTGTSETTEPAEKPRHDGVRRNGVRVGKVITLKNLDQCLDALRGVSRGDQLRLRRLDESRKGHLRLYVVRKDRRVYAIDERCRMVQVEGGRVGRH